MTPITLHNGKSVNVPQTGEEWELYSHSMKCGRAARSITAAVVRVIRKIDAMAKKGYLPTQQGLNKLYIEEIYPVLQKYDDFGALDTEPRYHATATLARATERLGMRIEPWG